VEEGSFDKARLISYGISGIQQNKLKAAAQTGAHMIDLSGAALEDAEDRPAVPWFPKLDSLRGEDSSADGRLFGVPSAAATATSALALALSKLGSCG